MVKIDGQFYDIPKAIRCWQKFDHNTRADRAASHRLGYRQRQQMGSFFYVHALAPGLAFDSPSQAYRHVLRNLANA